MLAFLVGFFLGSRSENGLFGNFNGSRPLTDGQIANAVLISVTVGVLSSALIWAGVMAAVWLILGQAIDLSSLPSTIKLLIGSVRLLGLAILGIGAIWGAVGLMTSLILAGRKVCGIVVGTVIGVWIVGGIGSEFLPSPEAKATFLRAILSAYIVLPLVGIAAAFAASWRLRLISRSTLVLAASIVVTMFAAAYLLPGFTSEPDTLLPVLWGCCMTPLALAAAPLAVWWNRHR